jgi:thiamine biosynthesis lipoprotein ApbE
VGEGLHGHVIDPALGAPAQGALLAAVVLPSAMESDALSTALLVRGRAMLDRWQGAPEALRCLVAERAENGGYTVATKGISASVE